MTRKCSGIAHVRWLWLLAAMAILQWTGTTDAAGRAESSRSVRPNLIFLLVDDLGWTDLGCFGSDLYETPNIDRLASEGMRVELYNLREDVRESKNLTGEMPTRTDRLRNMLHQWRETVGAQMPTPNPQYDPALDVAKRRFRKPAPPHGA